MTTRTPLELQPYRRPSPRPDPRATPSIPGRSFTTDELFAGATEIAIAHQGSVYRLKITRQGKLILNK